MEHSKNLLICLTITVSLCLILSTTNAQKPKANATSHSPPSSQKAKADPPIRSPANALKPKPTAMSPANAQKAKETASSSPPPNAQKAKLSPPSGPTGKENTTTKKEPLAIPYETVNNFCVHRRRSVSMPFCLRVLKTPNTADTKSDDFKSLLELAMNSTSKYVCKTITFFQDMSENKRTKATLKPIVEECLSAYEEIAGYITNVISDGSQESIVAGSDGEVIIQEINRCIKALQYRAKNTEISDRNEEAKKYAKLLIDIADNLGSKKP